MPLKNDVKKEWTGWLVDSLGGREAECQQAMVGALKARDMPRCTIKSGTHNMWWRKDSLYVDIESTLDGKVTSTIHFQQYGSSLWIGRALDGARNWNYYKRMATSAFIQTVDRCITEPILTLVDQSAIHPVSDIGTGAD